MVLTVALIINQEFNKENITQVTFMVLTVAWIIN